MSDAYFVDRQDQYIIIRDYNLSKYLHELLVLIAEYFVHHNSKDFQAAHRSLESNNMCLPVEIPKSGVTCFPLISLPEVPINNLLSTSQHIFDACSEASVNIMTPYFNLPKILKAGRLRDLSVYTSSTASNCFRNLPGFSGFVPFLYLSNICKHFAEHPQHKLYEYANSVRTFHAKGLHILFTRGLLSTIGSSNWNYRSLFRDNELELLMISKDENFVQRQHRHFDSIKKDFILTDLKKYNISNLLHFRALSRVLRRFL